MNTSRKHLLSLALITALSPIASTTAFAQLYLEIAKAPDQAPKIAIVPFTNDNGLYPIVETDLNRSGRFTSSSKNLPANAAINQIQASDWQTAGIPYVVTGQIKQTATGFEVHYQLYDVQKQQYILNELLNVPTARIRQAGHMVSDAIYQALTGIPGDFSGRIAYVLRNPATPAERYTLQIADTDGEQPKTVLSSRDPILSPAWTPDAKKIAYVSFETKRPAIYLQDLSTRQVKRMTNDSAIDTEARYTPDGKSFIFTSDRGGSAQIYRYTFADGSVKRLTFKGSFNARGTLSADGKKIALVHRPSGSSYKVAIQDINTGITNILTPTSLDESPSFSPNGQMVVYATREGNRGLLSIMSTDGRFRMNLPSEQGEVREPAWAPK